MRKTALFVLFVLTQLVAVAQTYTFSGVVCDAENGNILPTAVIQLFPSKRYAQTNENGRFSFRDISSGKYRIEINYFGYDKIEKSFEILSDTVVNFNMHPVHFSLSEVIVHAKHAHDNMQKTLPVQHVSKYFILQNNSINFVKTLSNISGIASMDIGAGFSKPVIRGLGFNRVAVVDKGIVQQNQQWGADHGLEIDQYDVENVNIHKGPMSLFFGSDAIGGVIEIKNPNVPQSNGFNGEASLIAKSNNDLLGASVMTRWKHNRWFFRSTMSAQRYGDYRIPTDTIDYLTWKIPVANRCMKNTAGKESAFSLSANYVHKRFETWLHVSDVYGKNGFFPGSHGIPDITRLKDDGDSRNIDMPFSCSNHLKIINNSILHFQNNLFLFDIGFQQNYRQEVSAFHTHYSNQLPPADNPDLELQFVLNIVSANLRYVTDDKKCWSKTLGISSEFQYNRVAGYSFLLPDFERRAAGIFFINDYKIDDKWLISGGLRYDIGSLHVHGFFDNTLEEYLQMMHYLPSEQQFYAQRADELHKHFNDVSGSVGFSFSPNVSHTLKANIGRSFRFPGANELAANGVHHGAFRHEKGSNRLHSERGYQMDVDYLFKNSIWSIVVNPFFTYFDNYIYLNPTGKWSVLPHAGQIYAYEQARAIITGGEINIGYALNETWSFSSEADYVYNINIDNGYPLPFSPPARWTNSVEYLSNPQKTLQHFSAKLSNRMIFDQHRIALNEEKTPGANLWNLSLHTHWRWQRFQAIADLQVQNIFDTPYLNHLSFYRKLNAPEPGRNVQLILKIPF